jgi:FOG: WD40-like repeat
VSNGVVYFAVANGKFYALDADTGETQWVNDHGGGYASPTVVDGTVYTQRGGSVYAFDAGTGNQHWSYSIGSNAMSSGVQTDAYFSADPSPAVKSGLVFAGLDTLSDRGVYALSKYTGEKIWKCSQKIYSSPTVVDGTIYAGIQDGVCAIKTFNGNKKWTFDINGRVTSSPTVAGSSICVGGPDEETYVIDSEGSKKQEYGCSSPIESSPTVFRDYALHRTNGGALLGWNVSDYAGTQSDGTRVKQRVLGHHDG